MTTRIGTYGANQLYIARMMATQERIQDESIQLTSKKKSLVYSGISKDSNRLINFENEMQVATQFQKTNTMALTKIDTAEVAISAIEQTIKDFETSLSSFYSGDTKNQQRIEDIQKNAFDSMIAIQGYLNIEVDGQYIFSGGRVSSEPMSLPASSLSGFQTIYDGYDHTYPTTRSAHMYEATLTGSVDFSATAGTITKNAAANNIDLTGVPVGARITVSNSATAANDQTYTVVANTTGTLKVSRLTTEVAAAATFSWDNGNSGLTNGTTGAITFAPGTDTITAANAGSLSTLAVGTVFTVAGTTNNNGTYQVKTNTGTVVTIESTKISASDTADTVTISASDWYQGDTIGIKHRIDTGRTVDLGIYASDPAFEKAIRAMGIIAQGAYGTNGGLEHNQGRISAARYLLADAKLSPAAGTAPYGTEDRSDLESLTAQLGTTKSIITERNKKHKSYESFLATRAGELENSDQIQIAALLKIDQAALEASFAVMSTVRQTSLLDYLR